MLDMKMIRQNVEFVKEKLATRNVEGSVIDELISLDETRRELIVNTEHLKAERNEVSDKISQLKRNKENADYQITRMREVGKQIKELDAKLEEVKEKQHEIEVHLPNIPAESVPVSLTEEGAVELRKIGEPRKFTFNPKAHYEIGEDLNILDFQRGAKVSGSRFLYYVGKGAVLERAIYNYYLDRNIAAGYTEVIPPYMVNSESMFGTGQFPKFKETKAGFEVKDTDLTMIPTAEVPLVNYYRDEVLTDEQLPTKFTALSPAFRSEAGSAGKDTRGLIRLHQFNKVEMVQFTKPENSWDALEEITEHAESLLKELEIPYHVIELTTSDMSFTAAKTYDLEVWMPEQNCYREISSCSNTLDFQARRSHIQYRDENDQLQFVHTLNGSGLAVGRTVAAILENYQNEDGTVDVPKVLQPYMNGLKIIQ